MDGDWDLVLITAGILLIIHITEDIPTTEDTLITEDITTGVTNITITTGVITEIMNILPEVTGLHIPQ